MYLMFRYSLHYCIFIGTMLLHVQFDVGLDSNPNKIYILLL